jgi:hypothetical protein
MKDENKLNKKLVIEQATPTAKKTSILPTILILLIIIIIVIVILEKLDITNYFTFI